MKVLECVRVVELGGAELGSWWWVRRGWIFEWFERVEELEREGLEVLELVSEKEGVK